MSTSWFGHCIFLTLSKLRLNEGNSIAHGVVKQWWYFHSIISLDEFALFLGLCRDMSERRDWSLGHIQSNFNHSISIAISLVFKLRLLPHFVSALKSTCCMNYNRLPNCQYVCDMMDSKWMDSKIFLTPLNDFDITSFHICENVGFVVEKEKCWSNKCSPSLNNSPRRFWTSNRWLTKVDNQKW